MTNTLLPSKFTGIIQLVPANNEELLRLQSELLRLFPTHEPITKLHVTLLHQSYPKKVGSGKERGDKLLKNMYKSGEHMGISTPSISFGDVYLARQEGRESTFVVVNEQDLCQLALKNILQTAGIPIASLEIDPESPEGHRTFHISLTNLTGNGGDSIAYPNPIVDERLEIR